MNTQRNGVHLTRIFNLNCLSFTYSTQLYLMLKYIAHLTRSSYMLTHSFSLISPYSNMMYMFGMCSLYGIIVLMPVNASGKSGSECTTSASNVTTCMPASLTGLDKISMSNIPPRDSRLWAHLISAYLFVAFACFFLNKVYDLVRWRIDSPFSTNLSTTMTALST